MPCGWKNRCPLRQPADLSDQWNAEIDSNMVENTIRPLALGRKNFIFAGSHDADEDIAMFYSFFGTCKKRHRPQLWLKNMMDNIQSSPAKKR
jgi:hypothetical protein